MLNGGDERSQARRRWLDLPPTTRHCCLGCYTEACKHFPTETEGRVHGTTLPSPSVNSRGYWKQEHRELCMQLEASKNREAAFRKENARLTGLTADIPIAGGHRGGTSRSRWSINFGGEWGVRWVFTFSRLMHLAPWTPTSWRHS
jgi:hypothetical protein